MRDTVRGVSNAEIHKLAELYGISVSGQNIDELANQVNERLGDSIDEIYAIPIEQSPDGISKRTWTEPTDDFYNAISIECCIPPVENHSELLAGTDVGLKDIISVAGVPMNCASGVTHGFVPSSDATVVERLLKAGGRITAKTNLDEFAGGGRGKSFRGLIRNPRDEDRIAGGSSGGSGAAVAAGQVDVALGTDTGGSVRKPSAFCGLVGFKPTYGLVPLTGVIENTYTLDHVGPIAKTIEDTARILEAIVGKDNRDPASMAAAGHDAYRTGGYVEAVNLVPEIGDVRIAVGTQGVKDEINETVANRHQAALDALEDAGATLDQVEIPYLDLTKHIKNIISYVELASYWRDGGAPVRRGGVVSPYDQLSFARRARAGNQELNDFYRSRLIAGAQLMRAHDGRHYTRAHAARHAIREKLRVTLSDYDALVTPTVPYLAPEIEHITDSTFDYDGLDEDMSFGYGRYTKIGDITGFPALTVPNDVDPGPAVGLQLMGQPFDEAKLFSVAKSILQTIS